MIPPCLKMNEKNERLQDEIEGRKCEKVSQ